LVILGGAIFGFWIGFFLAVLNSTIGASCAYLLSYLVVRILVLHFFPVRLAKFREELDKHRANLIWYLLFMRITPLVPNWFINLSSPIFNVPFIPFCVATIFGIMPAVGMFVQTGYTLHTITNSKDLTYSLTSIIVLLLLGFVSLLPTWGPVRDRIYKYIVELSETKQKLQKIR